MRTKLINSEATKADQLRIEEYKVLSGEIQSRMKEISDLERYSIVGIFGYYAWLETHFLNSDLLWSLPVVLALFVTIRAVVYAWRVNNIISEYISKNIEDKFGLTNGYESTMQNRLKCPIWRWSANLGGSTFFVWLALVIGTFFVAVCHQKLVGAAVAAPGSLYRLYLI